MWDRNVLVTMFPVTPIWVDIKLEEEVSLEKNTSETQRKTMNTYESKKIQYIVFVFHFTEQLHAKTLKCHQIFVKGNEFAASTGEW